MEKNMKQFAIDLAKEAGEYVKKNYGKIQKQELKADNSFVTNVDKETEKLIISRIKEKYPDHHIVAEESGENKKESEYKWIIDPIDGTHNFMHNVPLFSVSIGIAKDNEPYIGVIYFPALDELYSAEKGKGAFLNGRKISVSDNGFESAYIGMGANLNKGLEWYSKLMRKLVSNGKRVRVLGCATVNTTYVATGRFDAYVGRYGNVWDFAAGLVIAEEAGAKITDIDGKPYTLETKDFVMSNNKFHDELIKITKGI